VEVGPELDRRFPGRNDGGRLVYGLAPLGSRGGAGFGRFREHRGDDALGFLAIRRA
jgi:hypothetical protein